MLSNTLMLQMSLNTLMPIQNGLPKPLSDTILNLNDPMDFMLSNDAHVLIELVLFRVGIEPKICRLVEEGRKPLVS